MPYYILGNVKGTDPDQDNLEDRSPEPRDQNPEEIIPDALHCTGNVQIYKRATKAAIQVKISSI
jgi:hypothetical protein